MQDVAASLRQGAVQPSELPMLGIVKHEMKWYSRNNRRLWCFKAVWRHRPKVECDFLPTIAVQGVSQRVRQSKRSAQPQMCQRGRASAAILWAEEVSSSLGGCGREARRPSVLEAKHFGKRRTSAGRAGEKELAGFDFGDRRPKNYALVQDASFHPWRRLCKSLVWSLPNRTFHGPWGKKAKTLTLTTCQRTSYLVFSSLFCELKILLDTQEEVVLSESNLNKKRKKTCWKYDYVQQKPLHE